MEVKFPFMTVFKYFLTVPFILKLFADFGQQQKHFITIILKISKLSKNKYDKQIILRDF